MIDFDTLTAEQVDALTGHEREAWYAHRRGEKAKAAAILATYAETPETEDLETPEADEPAVETPEAETATETPEAPRQRRGRKS